MTVEDLLAQMRVGDVIQTIAVVIALAAAVIALIVSWRDRVNARAIAAKDRENALAIATEDRRTALEQAKLMFDLESLLRLLENLNRGGSTDQAEARRMGSEAMTLIGLLGRDLLPTQWARVVERDDDGLREYLDDEEFPQYKKDAIETQLAVNVTTKRIGKLLARD